MQAAHPRTALITGASSGLGAAIALEMAAKGWSIAIGARREDRLAETAEKARTQGAASVYAGALDVTDDASVERFFEASERAVGVADVIVNNAGASRFHWLDETDPRWLRSEVETNLIGEVYRRIEKAGLRIVAGRMQRLSQAEAEAFYAVHRERPFYKDLVRYMTSGPVMVQVLEGENAIQRNRDIMGATDPKKAAPGTIRADFAASIEQNVVHGSDAADTAEREIRFFFSDREICERPR